MIYCICAIFDSAVQSFGRPVFVPANGAATRSFYDEINHPDGKSDLAKHPDDFELYFMGTFDDQTATWKMNEPQLLARGKDVRALALNKE